MIRSAHDYQSIYASKPWAYGDKPDPQLIRALVGLPRGRALDVGGGQGRHALALAELGFQVTVIDSAINGLHQVSAEAEARSLPIHVIHDDVAGYESDEPLTLVVAALFFHIPARRTSLKIAGTLGGSLEPGGLFYVTLPGFTAETQSLVEELIGSAGCEMQWITKHLVTRRDRPRLPVARRNETRALAKKD